jgi:type II secretory pathway pseudopilin PulG
MNLTPSDIALESRKRLTETLFGCVRGRLEVMRALLEDGRALEALESRDALLPELHRLAGLLGEPAGVGPPTANVCGAETPGCVPWANRPLRSAGLLEADPEGLQAFRRAALHDLEELEGGYARLCAAHWRSGADEARSRAVCTVRKRSGWALGLAAALLACWWGWQGTVAERARTELDRAKSETAAEGVRLIGMAAWVAMKTQGKPLSEIAKDMSGECSDVDVRNTLPNHPCREVWSANSQALFLSAVPRPGAPVDAPSEVFSDPWGNPYILLIPKDGPPRVVSAGPDGRLGTADDVGVDVPDWFR